VTSWTVLSFPRSCVQIELLSRFFTFYGSDDVFTRNKLLYLAYVPALVLSCVAACWSCVRLKQVRLSFVW